MPNNYYVYLFYSNRCQIIEVAFPFQLGLNRSFVNIECIKNILTTVISLWQ